MFKLFTTMLFVMATSADPFSVEITQEGTGDFPEQGNKIIAHYEGTLLDGTVFDSSVKRNRPFEFVLG